MHGPAGSPCKLGRRAPRLTCAPLVPAFAGRMRELLGGAQRGAGHGSTRASRFRSTVTSSGRSGATVLMAGSLSSSPRTRLTDDRYTDFSIMPATLSNASAAAAAAAAVATVPHSDSVRDESSGLLSGVFASGGTRDARGDDQHRSACRGDEATAPAPFSGHAETSKAATGPSAGGYFSRHQ